MNIKPHKITYNEKLLHQTGFTNGNMRDLHLDSTHFTTWFKKNFHDSDLLQPFQAGVETPT
jgi:hypothetical protein